MTEEKCHLCSESTEFYCQDCDEPVCESCCVIPTYMNQIDYMLCTECGDGREADAMAERERIWQIEAAIKAKKAKRAATRKANYWKPENVEKRRAKRVALLLARQEEERSEEHTSELQSHSIISYAVFCLKKKKN